MTRGRTIVIVFSCSALLAAPARTQDKVTDHTFKLGPGAKSPPATITDMAWLAGHWTGEALGGISEETGAPPEAAR